MAEIGDELRVALGGAWGYAARATVLEEAIREAGGAGARRIGAALDAEGRSFREDHRGSAAYRRELAIQAIAEGLAHLATENGAMR